jgi:hypothetical protein
MNWPKDTQAARNAFYGDPGKGQIASQMVPVVPPFAMYYDGKRVKAIQFHQKAAPALLAALNEIWDYCQHDQAKVDASGASNYNGAYNHRMVRGSSTKWSNHAYATAIDLNAGENALGVKKGTMPQFIVDAFCRQGAMWGGWYNDRPDWMHFEFVDNGGRKPKSAPPVFGASVPVASAPADELEEDTEHEAETAPAPKAMSTSKIGVTQIATGTTAAVVGTAQVASSVVGQVNDVADQVSTVTDKAGSIIETTKTVVAIPKPGFWFHVLHAITSPVFIACVCLMIVVACGLTWYWRRQHAKAGV